MEVEKRRTGLITTVKMVFYPDPKALGEMKIVGGSMQGPKDCSLRPKGPKFQAEAESGVGFLGWNSEPSPY